MDRGAWRAAVHGVAKGQTRLSGFHHPVSVPCGVSVLGHVCAPGECPELGPADPHPPRFQPLVLKPELPFPRGSGWGLCTPQR